MIDRLFAAGVPLENPIAVVMDEAVAYYLTQIDPEKRAVEGGFGVREFPRCLSPWPIAFFEFRIPATERRLHSTHTDEVPYAIGAYAWTMTKAQREEYCIDPAPDTLGYLQSKVAEHYGDAGTAAAWMTTFILWQESPKGNVFGPLVDWTVCYADNGDLLPLEGNWPTIVGGYIKSEFFPTRKEQEGFSQRMIFSYLYPFLFTLSLANCRNVTRVRNTPPNKLSRKYQRKHGRPLTTYYTLNIEPMKQVLRDEGQSETLGLKHALHICRGHFADYTTGKGLFGKHHGMFWVPQHMCGSLEHGEIRKDYNVKAPTGVVE